MVGATWGQIFQEYTTFLHAQPTCPVCSRPRRRPLFGGSDAALSPYWSAYYSLQADDKHPEWEYLPRRHVLHRITAFLAPRTPALKEDDTDPYEGWPFWAWFKVEMLNFKDDVLLLDAARTSEGTCQFFFSFAFWSQRAKDARGRNEHMFGPGLTLRWNYLYPGTLLRELAMGIGYWFMSIGLILLYYTHATAYVTLWWVGASCCAIGFAILLMQGPSIESWGSLCFQGYYPAATPEESRGWRWQQRLWHRCCPRCNPKLSWPKRQLGRIWFPDHLRRRASEGRGPDETDGCGPKCA